MVYNRVKFPASRKKASLRFQVTHIEVWALAVEERLPHLAATIDEMEEEKAFANHFYEECLEMASTHSRKQGVELRGVVRAA